LQRCFRCATPDPGTTKSAPRRVEDRTAPASLPAQDPEGKSLDFDNMIKALASKDDAPEITIVGRLGAIPLFSADFDWDS
jgi:hypothetical protein